MYYYLKIYKSAVPTTKVIQTAGEKGRNIQYVLVKRGTLAQGCSGVHPCACEQKVGKKRKKTG